MHVEAIKEENRKSERIVGQVSNCDIDSRRLLTIHGKVWVPYSGRARLTLIEEAHKYKFLINPRVTKKYKDIRHNY